MNELIAALKAQGFSVHAPANLTTYVWFTDGVRIGYAQNDRMTGVKYATVHKANRFTGTGFTGVPMPEKYANFEAFRKQHRQPLEAV